MEKFGDAALRCKKAGFQILEIHGAAGCLPTNFLSPHDNQRTDMYGGSLHNRMRFLLEIIQNIKQKCGTNFPVGVKLSTEDWEPAGITLDETIQVAKALEKAGCSHINLICGTHATSDREFLMPNEFNNKETKAIQDAVSIPCFAGHNILHLSKLKMRSKREPEISLRLVVHCWQIQCGLRKHRKVILKI